MNINAKKGNVNYKELLIILDELGYVIKLKSRK